MPRVQCHQPGTPPCSYTALLLCSAQSPPRPPAGPLPPCVCPLPQVSHMASFNTAAFPDSLALGKADSLLIGTIDEIQVGASRIGRGLAGLLFWGRSQLCCSAVQSMRGGNAGWALLARVPTRSALRQQAVQHGWAVRTGASRPDLRMLQPALTRTSHPGPPARRRSCTSGRCRWGSSRGASRTRRAAARLQ